VGGAWEPTIDPVLLLAVFLALPSGARFLGALVSKCLAEDEIPLVYRQMFLNDRYLTFSFNCD
jgi:hypothetical protein